MSARSITLYHGNSLALYQQWRSPMVIISDGPYGLGRYEGDPSSPDRLPEMYEPHIRAWSEQSIAQTTLWFWNSEIGWALVHPILARYGWKYVCCNIWDKGIGHVAGNSNTKTLREFPVVTEVCVQYVRDVRVGGETLQDWLRGEWERAGLALYRANEACGVANAATRKYLTKDDLWYFPPPEMFERLAVYANERGRPEGRPYFSLDGQRPASADDWSRQRAKFYCKAGITNVWRENALRNHERLKSNGNGGRSVHLNQKPLRLMEQIVEATSDPGDMVWEPFGGLSTGVLAALRLNRAGVSAEINRAMFELAAGRLRRAATTGETRPTSQLGTLPALGATAGRDSEHTGSLP